MMITAEMILSFNPSLNWAEDQIRVEVPAPISVLDFLKGEGISPEKKLYVVLREGLCPEQTARLFACVCAERRLLAERSAGREPDARLWEAIMVGRRYADGLATPDELEATRHLVTTIWGNDPIPLGEWSTRAAARTVSWVVGASPWEKRHWRDQIKAAEVDPWFQAWDVAHAAAYEAACWSTSGEADWTTDWRSILEIERAWQVARLIELLEES